jgi:ABC-type bacteriocin/lantibiotic exporter with double-glycine peptidase domain
MYEIRRVVQEDETGCGIACVAMLSGQSYAAIKRLFVQKIFQRRRQKLWTRHSDIQKALAEFGIETRRRRFKQWKNIQGIAVVPIDRRKKGYYWHWVIAIVKDNKIRILDPEEFFPRKRVLFGRPKARGMYLEVIGFECRDSSKYL